MEGQRAGALAAHSALQVPSFEQPPFLFVDPLKDLVFFLFLMRQQERKLQATPKTLQDDEHEKTCRDGCHKNCYNFFSQHLTLRVCNGQGSEREYVFVASIVKVKMEF
ncbi:hypothetical protein RJ640_001093 [Escallonia rubra]|uniref:Uncharacterized protein n=1 Tax=Escallonia rubra TaxID=112253 RepID=A0AA88QAH5_9ASTE|nr:hypothetical protein RJ640_001093 [Escallonia rubra]